MLAYLHSISALLLHPLTLFRTYPRHAVWPDLVSAVTVGLILLPQALAFSLLAGLPPVMGLYTAITASIVGALWGSSSHLNSGPTNTAAILTFSVLTPIAVAGSPDYIVAAGLIAVMAGLIRLMMGLARLGMLVNFVSDSVAVGFTAGAGILIVVNQIQPLLRIDLPLTTSLLGELLAVVQHLETTHLYSLAVGIGTILLIMLVNRLPGRLPSVLIGLVVSGLVVWLLDLEDQGVTVLGTLPHNLPPLASLPFFDVQLIGHLANGALALALIGLVEAVAIARSIANTSRQRLDSNQEFVGQGLANIASGLFSGYPCSASFNRSALSYQAGAHTAVSNVMSGLFVLGGMFLLTPLIAHLPNAALAGTLILTAVGMIDRHSMVRIWLGARGDAVIMSVTLLTTLLLPLQFAVLIGVLLSLSYYLLKTSTPRVQSVLPDATFRHWLYQPHNPVCPQLAVMEILGDLYFGAVNHVEESINASLQAHPRQRFLLLRMSSVQHCDISGIRALESIMQICRDRGGDLFVVQVREPVLHLMQTTGFYEILGADRFLAEDHAISTLFYHVIDPAVCIYECEVRAFLECQNLPKRILPVEQALPPTVMLPDAQSVPLMTPGVLWRRLRTGDLPCIIDVREPREFHQGHIPGARLFSLSQVLDDPDNMPHDCLLVLVCRSGRRSQRAAQFLLAHGYTDLAVLEGGMVAWEAVGLLEAVE